MPGAESFPSERAAREWLTDRQPGPRVRATRFEVSLLPENFPDGDVWSVIVEYRGGGLWAVRCRTRTLGADGSWSQGYAWRGGDREPATDAEWDDYNRGEDEWLAAHRFDLDTALRLAREAAPGVTVNGITAAEALRRREAA